MLRVIFFFLASVAVIFFLIGVILMFTIFWLFIGLPFIIIGLVIWLIVWLIYKNNLRKIKKKARR